MNKSYHSGLIYNLLAIACGIGAYHFFGRKMVQYPALYPAYDCFCGVDVLFIPCPYFKSGKIIYAVRKKDFSLFPGWKVIR